MLNLAAQYSFKRRNNSSVVALIRRIILLTLFCSPVLSYSESIKGKITSPKSDPLEGVNVHLLNSISGSATDGQGNFELPETTTQLGDIIVTAQKTEEEIQQLSLSVSVISSARIQQYRLWNNKDITAIVPNLYSSNPGDGRNVTSIRGITSAS